MYQNTISFLQSLRVCVCTSLFCCMLLYLDPKVETYLSLSPRFPELFLGRALRFAWGRCYRIQHDPVHTQNGSREYGLRKIICKEMFVLMLVVDSVSHPELGLHKCSGIHHDAKHPWMLACAVMLMKVHRILLFFLSG